VAGSRVLEVRGRKSGEPRRTPVNLMTFEGGRYLVAPRGHTQWVRNLRAQGEGRLLVGRRAERFSGGVGPEAAEEELRRIAPDHPVFRLN
jgi:deazaflavin-dependent oxidoreductase (nitroreductase family)